MIIYIYSLEKTPSGKIPGREILGTVELSHGDVRIEAYEEKLKKKLEDIFSTPLIKRAPSKPEISALFHREIVVEPFTEDFFEEVIYSLFKHDLYGTLQR